MWGMANIIESSVVSSSEIVKDEVISIAKEEDVLKKECKHKGAKEKRYTGEWVCCICRERVVDENS